MQKGKFSHGCIIEQQIRKGKHQRGGGGKVPLIMENKASSEDLMAQVAHGDEFAFELLVRRHEISVLNLIYRYIGDRTKAKDLAQEVFIRVWRAANRYEPKAKFTTWIYSITANLCLNELKSVKSRNIISFETEEDMCCFSQ